MASPSLKKLSLSLFLVGLGFLAFKTFYLKSIATEIPMKNAVALQSELPLYFIENQGQATDNAKFLARGMKESLSFTPTGIDFRLPKNQHFALNFKNASKKLEIKGDEKQAAEINYLIGKKSDWKTHIATYREIVYQGIYPGIDLVLKGNTGRIKYEFHVAKNARPDDILLAYENINGLKVNDAGDLVIQGAMGEMKDQKPFIYQDINGERVEVPGKFVVKGKEAYGFGVGSYNKNYALVIDPSLIYSTFIGGASDDVAYDIAVDGSGNAYITGSTSSASNFASSGAYDTSQNGGDDAFVTKLASDGKSVTWTTYLGGTAGDTAYGIAVDSSGKVYVTGYTSSTDFPTANAYQSSHASGSNSDIFITKLNSAGTSILYSSYLGGTSYESGYGIAVDGSGNAYIAGYTSSTGSIAKTGSYDTSQNGSSDIFVSKFDTTASGDSSLVYSTYVGGSGSDTMDNGDMAIDSSGNAYVAGTTTSTENSATPWPLVGAYDSTHNGGTNDMFVFKLNSAGTSLTYSTFVGGTGADVAYGIAVDSSGQAYVTGKARGGMPTSDTNSSIKSYDPSFNKTSNYDDVYVFKLNAAGDTILYSTYLGGTYAYYYDRGWDIAVDSSEKVHICGEEQSTAFPTTNDAYDTTQNQEYDWFYTKLDTTVNGSSSLVYSTYLGSSWSGEICYGIAIDSAGNNVYLTGQAGAGNGQNFPSTTGAAKTGIQAQPVDSAVVHFGPNTAPTANAGPTQNVLPAAPVTLSGIGSTDNEGNTLTYSWSQTSGTAVTLSSSTAASPTFTAPNVSANATLVFSLTVNDGTVNSASASTVSINVNAKPLANNQTQSTDINVALNLTLSGSDPDNESLTYSIVSSPGHGSLGTLSGTSVTYTPTTNYKGADSFTFRVNDGRQYSAAATVSIDVGSGNHIPVADAGADQSNKNPNTTVTLNGTASYDLDSDSLTYSWVQTSGPTVSLSSATASSPTFTARASGSLVFRLIVNDGAINSNADSVIITVNNVAPVANAGPDSTMTAGNSYKLQGSATDANGDTLTYTWTKVEGLVTTVTNGTTATPTFTTSSMYPAGSIFKFRLTVSDGKGGSATDDVWITLMAASQSYTMSSGSYIMAPTTSTVTTSTTTAGVTTTINTTDTIPPPTTPLAYTWEVVSKPTGATATINNSTSADATFMAKQAGDYTVRSCVSDGTEQTCSNIIMTTPNYAPVIAKSVSTIVQTAVGKAVDLSSFMSASDDNGDALITTWAQSSGKGALSIGTDGKIDCVTHKCPRGENVIQATVVDSNGATAVDSVTVTFPNNSPVAPPTSQITFGGADANVQVTGDQIKYQTFTKDIVLDNVIFSDDDDDNLAYNWSLTKPYGMTATNAFGFKDAGSGKISLTAKIPGTYQLTMTVGDGYGVATEKVITVVVPVPEVSELPVEVLATDSPDGTQEVSGTVSSPIMPEITVNGVEAIVAAPADTTASLSARSLMRHTDASSSDSTYDTYSFQADSVPKTTDMDVEVFADMDGERVSMSKTTIAGDSTGDGTTDGTGSSGLAVVGGCGYSSLNPQPRGDIPAVLIFILFFPAALCFLIRRRFH